MPIGGPPIPGSSSDLRRRRQRSSSRPGSGTNQTRFSIFSRARTKPRSPRLHARGPRAQVRGASCAYRRCPRLFARPENSPTDWADRQIPSRCPHERPPDQKELARRRSRVEKRGRAVRGSCPGGVSMTHPPLLVARLCEARCGSLAAAHREAPRRLRLLRMQRHACAHPKGQRQQVSHGSSSASSPCCHAGRYAPGSLNWLLWPFGQE